MRFIPKYIKKLDKIRTYISEGEHENQDFKVSISSQIKIAKTIVAFANTSGGRILIGVDDKGQFTHIDIEEEMYMMDKAAKEFCVPPINLKFRVHQEDEIEVLEVIVPIQKGNVFAVLDESGNKKVYHRVRDQVIHIKQNDSH